MYYYHNLFIMETISLRQQFINYFRGADHKFLKPSDVFIKNDPTLLFVNAGMNQLKNTFLGIDEFKKDYDKLMNSQICIRAGGKHNDFDDVGKDSYHLTCFEMLGNWSLDSYGKEKAIDLAFNFLVGVCKLQVSQMYVTYFEGDENVPEDIETKEIWKKYVPENRIIKGTPKDNFWMMADDGPCGFCTEIHYDLLGDRGDVPELVNADDPTLVEIWNIVFIQYNKIKDQYIKLDKFFVDTGMGLERISMILQNKQSIYEIDTFRYLIGYAQALSGAEFYTNNYMVHDDVDFPNYVAYPKDVAYRIFADHIRTSVISVYQGVEFDAHGRGFILRKIFRRLLTYYYIYLANGLMTPIMAKGEIKLIISHILNYFLFGKHDADLIQKKFIDEEKLALDKWSSIHIKYRKYLKVFNGNHDKACEKLKSTDGIDGELIKNMDRLVIRV
jgi:alanyl-tRNA synthetase